MTIKRAFLIVLAAILLPGLAWAQSESFATFTVSKDFSDNNEAIVNVHLSCFGGDTLDDDKPIWEGQNVVFNVEDFGPGTNCIVTEGDFPGYTTSYSEDCEVNDIESTNYDCEITNTLDPVIGTIYKNWEFEGEGGDSVDGDYKITVHCPAGSLVDPEWSNGYDYIDFHEYNNTDDTSFTFAIYPDWDGGSTCNADETVYDSSVESSNGCDDGQLHFEVDGGASCTITNTVFYEGIPTLSQYGMAILALLMLGVGFVGFRRFV